MSGRAPLFLGGIALLIVSACGDDDGDGRLVADVLGRMGYGDVAHLDGGFKAWKEGGLPVEDVRESS